MKITKFGHCCLLIEENGVRVLTDPGSYTETQDEIKNIDVILITHEHQDHFHIPSVKKILENNQDAIIITNSSVGNLLKNEGIDSVIVEDSEDFTFKEVKFRGFGKDHAVIYKEMGLVENTGYFVGEKLFYPGDSFFDPKEKIEILAVPFAGPWMKISEAIEYVLKINPKKCFPVHDGGLNPSGQGFGKRVAPQIFQNNGIEFISLEIDEETEF